MNSNERLWQRRTFLSAGLSALATVLIPVSGNALTAGLHHIRRTAYAMGTTVEIQAYGPDRDLIMEAIDDAFGLLYRYDRTFSIFNPDSPISRINRTAGGKPVRVEPDVIDLMRKAVEASRISCGAFDCTIEPLMRLWGFYDGCADRWPTDGEIRQVMEGVGSHLVCIDEDEQSISLLHENASIDLGGIAVGYTVDAMAAILRTHGVESALINHSGDLYAIGAPPEESGWKIGIQSDFTSLNSPSIISLNNQAVSTSNNSRNHHDLEGIAIGHLLDAQSGTPIRSIRSVTVVADTCTASDIFSTAYFVDPIARTKSDNFGTILDIFIVENNASPSTNNCLIK